MRYTKSEARVQRESLGRGELRPLAVGTAALDAGACAAHHARDRRHRTSAVVLGAGCAIERPSPSPTPTWCSRRTPCTASPGATTSTIAIWRGGTTSDRIIGIAVGQVLALKPARRRARPRRAAPASPAPPSPHHAAAAAERRRRRDRAPAAGLPRRIDALVLADRASVAAAAGAGRRHLAAGAVGSGGARGLCGPGGVRRQRHSRLRQSGHHQARRQLALRVCAQQRTHACARARMWPADNRSRAWEPGRIRSRRCISKFDSMASRSIRWPI